MSQFEYLSVLVSIIIGLALTQLLSGAARLIQLRRRVPAHATTLCWMTTLFLVDIQIWWAAFDRRDIQGWNFFLFLLWLLLPVLAFLLSYLVLPELGDEDEINLAANFEGNRNWFFGLLALLPGVSLVEEALRSGAVPIDADAVFRVVLILVPLVAGRIANARFQFWNALLGLAMVSGYVALLFLRLH